MAPQNESKPANGIIAKLQASIAHSKSKKQLANEELKWDKLCAHTRTLASCHAFPSSARSTRCVGMQP